ncbi:barstar family protein [Streptomyces sp. NPDC057654]|uniref:barstar family protein n=1 Tax=Streptomyces sp. NPDC057654 TaxID=3346196 RepID=UPI0036BBB6E1
MTGLLPAAGIPGLLSGAVAPGVYHWHPPVSVLRTAHHAAEAGWRPAVLNLHGVTDKDSFLARCAADLELPDWFGHNWDALADCLTDLSWWGEARGYLLLVEGWHAFRTAVPEDADIAADIFAESVNHWADGGSPMTVLLTADS